MAQAQIPADAQASARGGNGGGYNGPVMSGDSIPLQLERGITVTEVTAAIKTCLVTGNSAAGIVSVFERLQTTIYGRAEFKSLYGPTLQATALSYDNKQYGPGAVWLDAQAHIEGEMVSGQPYTTELMKFSTSPGSRDGSLQGTAVFTLPYGPRKIETELYLPAGLPLVHFESIVPDSHYDELGNVNDDGMILKGLSIRLPRDYGSAVPLFNGKTHRKSSATLNLEEYVQCLQSRIQPDAGR